MCYVNHSNFWQQNLLLRAIRILISSLSLGKQILFRKPNIIHFFLPTSYLLGAPISLALSGAQLVMSRRSLNNYQRRSRILRVAERILHHKMQAITGNSERVVQQLVHEENSPIKRTGLIYNGIPRVVHNQDDLNSLRQELDTASFECTLAIVANLIPYKGHENLLLALAETRTKTKQNWQLLIVGNDGGIETKLKRLSTELDLDNRVKFLGSRTDARAIFAISDIGLLTSNEEGFSNAILEGMAESLPFIATDVGGNAEAIAHNVTGLIVPPRDTRKLTDAILWMLNNPKERQSMGKKGRERVMLKFSIEKCVQKYDQLYTALASGKSTDNLAFFGNLDV